MVKGLLASAIVAGLMAGNIALAQEEGAASETKKTTTTTTATKKAKKAKKDCKHCKGHDGDKKEAAPEKAPEGQD